MFTLFTSCLLLYRYFNEMRLGINVHHDGSVLVNNPAVLGNIRDIRIHSFIPIRHFFNGY